MINKILYKLFNRYYVGQIISRSRDIGFNKIAQLDLEIVEVEENTLIVKFICTGNRTVVLK